MNTYQPAMRVPIGMIFLTAVILLAWAVPAHGQEIFVNENAPPGAPRPTAGTYTEQSVTITFDRPVYVENYHANILRNDLRIGADGGWKGEIASVDIATTTETATGEITIRLVSPFPSRAEVYVLYTGANTQTIQYDLKSVSGIGVAHFDIRYLLFTGNDANAPRPVACGDKEYTCMNGVVSEDSKLENLNHFSWTCDKESNSIRGEIYCSAEKGGCAAGVAETGGKRCTLPFTGAGKSKDGTCDSGLIGECTYHCSGSTWRERSNSCRREAKKNCIPETINNCSLNFTVSPGNTMQGLCINPDDANERWQGYCEYTCTEAGVWQESNNTCAEHIPDTTPPILTRGEVSSGVITDQTEPTYTFTSSESGVLVVARANPGGCVFVSDSANGYNIQIKEGRNRVTLEKARNLPITSGDYTGVSGVKTCSFSVRDYYGNTSTPLEFTYTVISSDTTPPTLREVTPVPSPSTTLYPVYVFRSNEWGRITYSTKAGNSGRDCTSSSGDAYDNSHMEFAPTIVEPDTNTEVTFYYLYDGVTYDGCVITVKDKYGNAATLDINEFRVDWNPDLRQVLDVKDEIFDRITPELENEMKGQLKADNGRGKVLRDTLGKLTGLYKDFIYDEPFDISFAHYISSDRAVLVRLNKQLSPNRWSPSQNDGTLFTDDFSVTLDNNRRRSIAATAVYVDACNGIGNTEYCEREIYITLAESIPTGTSATVDYRQDSRDTITALAPTDIVLDSFSQAITTVQPIRVESVRYVPADTALVVRLNKAPKSQNRPLIEDRRANDFLDDFSVSLSNGTNIAPTAVYMGSCLHNFESGTACTDEIYITLAGSIPEGVSATLNYTQNLNDLIIESSNHHAVLDSFSRSVTLTPLTAQKQQISSETIIRSLQKQQGSSGTTVTSFTRNLTIGSIGEDVRALQQFLNRKGYTVNEPGRAGSSGFETTYFGPLTQDAVRRYQEANGITPPRGFFGPKTRAHVNVVLAGEAADQSPPSSR